MTIFKKSNDVVDIKDVKVELEKTVSQSLSDAFVKYEMSQDAKKQNLTVYIEDLDSKHQDINNLIDENYRQLNALLGDQELKISELTKYYKYTLYATILSLFILLLFK